MSDCAFGVDLATTSLDPTIETMIGYTVGNDATISENLHSSFSANYLSRFYLDLDRILRINRQYCLDLFYPNLNVISEYHGVVMSMF